MRALPVLQYKGIPSFVRSFSLGASRVSFLFFVLFSSFWRENAEERSSHGGQALLRPSFSISRSLPSACRAREAARPWKARGFQRSSISLSVASPHRVCAELGRLPLSVERIRLPAELHPAVCVSLGVRASV